MPATIACTPFGTTPADDAISLFTLRGPRGHEAALCTHGGILVRYLAPDRAGRPGDIVLGYDHLADYLRYNPFLGCLVGRYANRIAGAAFTLDGRPHRLAANDGPNCLHGGRRGFDQAAWRPEVVAGLGGPVLRLTHLSSDGDEGFPGALRVTADHELADDGTLRFTLTATTDAPTVVNLTQHTYFNLGNTADILGHELQLDAERFLPVDANLIPTGERRPVAGTPFDFRRPTPVGARIAADDEQLRRGRGYDHTYIPGKPADTLARHGRVRDPASGRTLEVWSTAPGVQFYSGNFLDGRATGKGGRPHGHRAGLCLEPQAFPDSPNQPAFPSCVLRPGETYRHVIEYRPGVD
ncbi:MAG: galactose mutarotase [Verrucomicrobia bacterium]|nr:galactose mutarotase [Verrucomicrobiota bacterium]